MPAGHPDISKPQGHPETGVAWPAIPELKKVLREMRAEDARQAARQALAAPTARDVTECLARAMGGAVDLEAYRGRWQLELPG